MSLLAYTPAPQLHWNCLPLRRLWGFEEKSRMRIAPNVAKGDWSPPSASSDADVHGDTSEKPGEVTRFFMMHSLMESQDRKHAGTYAEALPPLAHSAYPAIREPMRRPDRTSVRCREADRSKPLHGHLPCAGHNQGGVSGLPPGRRGPAIAFPNLLPGLSEFARQDRLTRSAISRRVSG